MSSVERAQALALLRSHLDRVGWADRFAAYADELEWVRTRPTGSIPSASIVVISWIVDDQAFRIIEETLRMGGEAFELIFVDNGSATGDSAAIAPLCHTCVRLARNTGAYFARNLASVFATAPLLIFLDDDAVPAKGFVAAHLEEHGKYEAIMVRGACLPKTSSPLNANARHYYLGDAAFPRYSDLEGNTSLAAEPFFAVGGWDDLIRFGHGGIDLTYRLLRRYPQPQRFLYSPRPVIRHDYVDSERLLGLKRRKQFLAWRYLQSKFDDIDAFLDQWTNGWSGLPVVARGEARELVSVSLSPRLQAGDSPAAPRTPPSKRDSLRNLARHYEAKGDLERAEHYRRLAETEAVLAEAEPDTPAAVPASMAVRNLTDRQVLALADLLASGAYDQVLAARDGRHPFLSSLLTASCLRKGDLAGAKSLLDVLPVTDETRLKRKALELLPRLAEPLKGEPRVHLVILCYNREKELLRSFENLARTDYRNYAVFVADNGSSDLTWERLREAVRLFPSHIPVHVERFPTNIGRPAGHNWLLTKYDHTAARYIAIGDDDLVDVPPNWLRDMLKTAELFPNAAAVGAKALDPGLPPVVHAGVRNITTFSDCDLEISNSDQQIDYGQFDFIDKVDHVIGCLQVYDRAMLFEEAGLFDIRFSPCQFVDVDHHLRIRTLGRDIIFNGFIRFAHLRAMGRKAATDRALSGNSVGNMLKIIAKYDYKEINKMIAGWRTARDQWLDHPE
ncbi:glycosyltransferase family 2 protein [Desulfolutivibrio sulfoxidireducens]|uniref:glycosyltransferase family 2 protein n=1 Tax=Desulfolutivibrio sulfoxidireducens TaxID=2773299 RepID=UPI00159D90C6|nr:glycosyltransferase [Desulfolutivibrio sulfoxidireducens]QLA16086.1 glycosyltransferase [Desulfolutivibrio sulfoxidireducens]